jgi:hypothetical protein
MDTLRLGHRPFCWTHRRKINGKADRQAKNIQGSYSSVLLQNILILFRIVFWIKLKEISLKKFFWLPAF